ncbi:MAG: hypothetical protein K2Q26_13685 [Bdellovibrionales bacterium]|nr:hypothetical protein [Bdellovibrionales bacterium]
MYYLKRFLLVVCSLMPIRSIAFAVNFASNVEIPKVSKMELSAEFFRRLDQGLLPDKYFQYFEENGIASSDGLRATSNSKILSNALKRFEKDMLDSALILSATSSVITE